MSNRTDRLDGRDQDGTQQYILYQKDSIDFSSGSLLWQRRGGAGGDAFSRRFS